MAQIKVYTKKGSESGSMELSPEVFGVKINAKLIELVTRMYANNKRTGNAHTKTRAEVSGGGARPWRQKGTGRARVSSIRSPLWRGGGTVFGPRKRDIYNVIPKKMRQKALLSSLTKKLKDGGIVVVDDMSFDAPKTKLVYEVLANLGIESRNVMWIASEINETIARATRNIEKLSVKNVSDVNAYHIMRKNIILFDTKSIKAIQERLLGSETEEKEATSV